MGVVMWSLVAGPVQLFRLSVLAHLTHLASLYVCICTHIIYSTMPPHAYIYACLHTYIRTCVHVYALLTHLASATIVSPIQGAPTVVDRTASIVPGERGCCRALLTGRRSSCCRFVLACFARCAYSCADITAIACIARAGGLSSALRRRVRVVDTGHARCLSSLSCSNPILARAAARARCLTG
jgi:hypothetical protein